MRFLATKHEEGGMWTTKYPNWSCDSRNDNSFDENKNAILAPNVDVFEPYDRAGGAGLIVLSFQGGELDTKWWERHNQRFLPGRNDNDIPPELLGQAIDIPAIVERRLLNHKDFHQYYDIDVVVNRIDLKRSHASEATQRMLAAQQEVLAAGVSADDAEELLRLGIDFQQSGFSIADVIAQMRASVSAQSEGNGNVVSTAPRVRNARGRYERKVA